MTGGFSVPRQSSGHGMVQYPVLVGILFYRNLPVLESIFCHGSIRNFCQSRAILCFRMEIFSLFLYSPMWGEKRKIDLFSIAKFAPPLHLTHSGRVTHICVSKLTIIGYSGLSGSKAIWRLNGSWSSMIQVIIWHLCVTKPLPEPILTQYWLSSSKHISMNFSSKHCKSLFKNLLTFSSDYFDLSLIQELQNVGHFVKAWNKMCDKEKFRMAPVGTGTLWYNLDFLFIKSS